MNQGEVGFDFPLPLWGPYEPVVEYGFVFIWCLNLVLFYLSFYVHSNVRQLARLSVTAKGLARFALCFQLGSAFLFGILCFAAAIAQAARSEFSDLGFVVSFLVSFLSIAPCLIGAHKWFRALSLARSGSDIMSFVETKERE